ncbi:hypothetical protein FKP32DRAFT_639160 [Trametes sanguinea]|nr:hypothetical protein FKP32DRAFT_639160 [Trametes sanguinea]
MREGGDGSMTSADKDAGFPEADAIRVCDHHTPSVSRSHDLFALALAAAAATTVQTFTGDGCGSAPENGGLTAASAVPSPVQQGLAECAAGTAPPTPHFNIWGRLPPARSASSVVCCAIVVVLPTQKATTLLPINDSRAAFGLRRPSPVVNVRASKVVCERALDGRR